MNDTLHRLLWPFWNSDQRRFRAPIRILLGVVAMAIVTVLFSQIPIIRDSIGDGTNFTGIESLLYIIASIPGYAVTVVVGAKLLDRRPLVNYGLQIDREWLRQAAAGAVIGAAMITGAVAFLFAFGWAELSGVLYNTTEYPFVVPAVLFLLFTAVNYILQIAFNIFLLKNVAEGLNGRFSPSVAVAGGIIFAVLFRMFLFVDVGDHGAYGAFVELVVHGTSLLAYVYTGNAGLPTSFGATWSVVAMFVFGVKTGAGGSPIALLDVQRVGPTGITGGEFGIDGGLAALFVSVVGLFLVFGWIRWQNDLHIPEHVYRRVERPDE